MLGYFGIVTPYKRHHIIPGTSRHEVNNGYWWSLKNVQISCRTDLSKAISVWSRTSCRTQRFHLFSLSQIKRSWVECGGLATSKFGNQLDLIRQFQISNGGLVELWFLYPGTSQRTLHNPAGQLQQHLPWVLSPSLTNPAELLSEGTKSHSAPGVGDGTQRAVVKFKKQMPSIFQDGYYFV